MINILLNPVGELLKAKQQKSIGKPFIVGLVAAILLAATLTFLIFGFALLTRTIARPPSEPIPIIEIVTSVLFVLVLIIVVEIIFALFTGTIMSTLGAKGGFLEGLITIVYPAFVLSVGLAAAVVLFLVYAAVTSIGGSIAQSWPIAQLLSLVFLLPAFLAILFTMGISTALVYRGLKELFETDMITAFVGMSVIIGITISIFYIALAAYMGLAWLRLSSLRSGGMI